MVMTWRRACAAGAACSNAAQTAPDMAIRPETASTSSLATFDVPLRVSTPFCT